MEQLKDDYNQMEVTYKFYLPDNENELIIFQNANKFIMALHEIYDKCRYIWKYEENATEAEVIFAESIGEIVSESGVFDV